MIMMEFPTEEEVISFFDKQYLKAQKSLKYGWNRKQPSNIYVKPEKTDPTEFL